MKFCATFHLVIHIIILLASISTSKVTSNNDDDDDEEITMRDFIPLSSPLSSSQESIYMKNLDETMKVANLSTILKLMKWTSGLHDEMVRLKTDVNEKGVTQFHGVSLGNSRTEILSGIDDTIKFLKDCERKLEHELRKPSKKWNYPVNNNDDTYPNNLLLNS